MIRMFSGIGRSLNSKPPLVPPERIASPGRGRCGLGPPRRLPSRDRGVPEAPVPAAVRRRPARVRRWSAARAGAGRSYGLAWRSRRLGGRADVIGLALHHDVPGPGLPAGVVAGEAGRRRGRRVTKHPRPRRRCPGRCPCRAWPGRTAPHRPAPRHEVHRIAAARGKATGQRGVHATVPGVTPGGELPPGPCAAACRSPYPSAGRPAARWSRSAGMCRSGG